MISDELLSKFDRIEALPVSEEMLGAYMEGNLNAVENLQVEQQVILNPDLQTFVKDLAEEEITDLYLDNTVDVLYNIAELPVLGEFRTSFHPTVDDLRDNNSIEPHGRNKKIKR